MRVGDMVVFPLKINGIPEEFQYTGTVLVLELFSSSETRLNYFRRETRCFRGLKGNGTIIEDNVDGWKVIA